MSDDHALAMFDSMLLTGPAAVWLHVVKNGIGKRTDLIQRGLQCRGNTILRSLCDSTLGRQTMNAEPLTNWPIAAKTNWTMFLHM